ncbi:MAG: PIN domain-containing protein [Chloroflexia bacterium]|nr:PIN domain-containing protein [Chloroflexia bacterium]
MISSEQLDAVTSTITLVEVLTRPLQLANAALVDRYTQFLSNTRELTIVELSVPVAREAARLRAVYNPRTPDAVQLATTITESATHFLTNDTRLSRVSELNVAVLDELG